MPFTAMFAGFDDAGMNGISISLQLMSFTEKTVQCRLEFLQRPAGRIFVRLAQQLTQDNQQGGVQ
ncbi:protein of unknown function [Agreia sp. COWG]|nr:protein of unknown function [Agreia sp. COWG]